MLQPRKRRTGGKIVKYTPPEQKENQVARIGKNTLDAATIGAGLANSRIPGAETIYDIYNTGSALIEGDVMGLAQNFVGALLPGLSGKTIEASLGEFLPKMSELNKEQFKRGLNSSPAENNKYLKKYGQGYLYDPKFIKEVIEPSMTKKKQSGARTAKYAVGSGEMGVGNAYIPSPAETLSDYNIMLGEVENKALSNPWLPAVTALGGIMSMASGAANNYATKLNGALPKAADGEDNVQSDVEVEGGEVLEDPQGTVKVAQGPNHEEGGIPLEMTGGPAGEGEIEEGTIVSSKRIIGPDGKTMADRKIERTLQKERLTEMLEKADNPTRNGLKRRLAFFDKEEKEDNDFQGFIKNLKESSDTVMAAFGTGEEGVQDTQEMALGGVAGPGFPLGFAMPTVPKKVPYPETYDEIVAFQKSIPGLKVDGDFGKNSLAAFTLKNGAAAELKPIGMEAIKTPITHTMKLPTSVGAPLAEDTSADIESFDPGYLPKMGDMVALAGQFMTGTTGSKMAAEQRSTDVTFQNEYANAGDKALGNIDETMGLIDQQESAAKVSATATYRGGKKNARNSARGINQLGAMNWLYDTQQEKAMTDITNSGTGQKVGQINKKADINLQADLYKGQGAQTAAQSNAAAKDAYYTALAKGEMDKGIAMQHAGKGLNDIAMNPLMAKLLASMGEYVTMDANGNITKKK